MFSLTGVSWLRVQSAGWSEVECARGGGVGLTYVCIVVCVYTCGLKFLDLCTNFTIRYKK